MLMKSLCLSVLLLLNVKFAALSVDRSLIFNHYHIGSIFSYIFGALSPELRPPCCPQEEVGRSLYFNPTMTTYNYRNF